jgi:hypothetical protein
MKKIVSPLLVIAALAAIAAFFIHRAVPGRHARASDLVPAGTIVFAHLPDIHGTSDRFTTTELYKLGQEPEVKAFLERPRAKAPQNSTWQTQVERIERVDPREAFLAVTSFDGTTPRLIAGFAFNGSRKAVQELIDPARAELQKTHPASKIDIVTYGGAEIELLTDNEFTVAQTIQKEWCLLATNLELLERTIDRLSGKKVAGESLATSALFREATAKLPDAREAIFYAELTDLTKRLADLMAASGQPVSKELENLKKLRAISAATSIEAGKFRDTIYVLAPGSAPQPPLARRSLALTAPATLLYYSAALPADLEIAEATRAALALALPPFATIDKAITEHQLQWSDLGTAFGPEVGFFVEWPQQSLQPLLFFSLDVRDREKAGGFVQALTSANGDTPAWTKEQKEGVDVYRMSPAQPQQLPIAPPSIALSDKFLVIATNGDAALTTIRRGQTKQDGLGAAPAFVNAQNSLIAPTGAYGYLNLQALFERAYGTFRPFIAMSLAFMPSAAEYIDASKLPTTEAVSKHLGQITVSQAQTADGILMQSTGVLTFNQAMIGMLAGSIGASLPALTNAKPGETLDVRKLFGLPGFPSSLPGAAPGPPAAPGAGDVSGRQPVPPRLEKESPAPTPPAPRSSPESEPAAPPVPPHAPEQTPPGPAPATPPTPKPAPDA